MAVAMDPGRQLRGVEGQIEGLLMAICFFLNNVGPMQVHYIYLP